MVGNDNNNYTPISEDTVLGISAPDLLVDGASCTARK